MLSGWPSVNDHNAKQECGDKSPHSKERSMKLRLSLLLVVLPLVVAASVALTLTVVTPAAAQQAKESLPQGAKIASLEVQPTSIELKNRFDYRQLLVIARLENGD